jgi:hypothetical protein
MTALAAALALAQAALAEGRNPAVIQPTDPSLAAHCLSRIPGRLALSEDQLARIDAIRRDHPDDTAERRAAILRVLTRTQWMVFWRTAGIAAC